jgi:hypothetical protein
MGRHDVGGCVNVTISEIEAAIGWWRARATSDAGFAGSVVGCALARMALRSLVMRSRTPNLTRRSGMRSARSRASSERQL